VREELSSGRSLKRSGLIEDKDWFSKKDQSEARRRVIGICS